MIDYVTQLTHYDGRVAVVTSWLDDYPASNFEEAIDWFQYYKLWFGCNIRTNYMTTGGWAMLQAQINQWYVEANSHSRSHSHTPYDYENEIGGSKNDILTHLTLPFGQYVFCYCEPYSETNDDVYAKCAEKKYLVDGRANLFEYEPLCVLVPFDAEKNIFVRQCTCVDFAHGDLAFLNAKFDTVYGAGGHYWLSGHPAGEGWGSGDKTVQHLAHISGKKDVWYAPVGHVYSTLYIKVKNLLTIRKVDALPSQIEGYVLPEKTSDDFFNDIEFQRKVGSDRYVGVHFKDHRHIFLEFVNGGQIFELLLPLDEHTNYGFQYPITLHFSGTPATEIVKKYVDGTLPPTVLKNVMDLGKAWGFRRWSVPENKWR